METRSLQDDDLNAGLFAFTGHSASSKWYANTSAEILSDLNALFNSLWASSANEEWSGLGELLLPVRSYWWLKRGVIDLLLRSRKARRPKRFTRR